MAVEIPNGSVAICNVELTGYFSQFTSADKVLAQLAQELVFDGLTITQSHVNISGIIFGLTGGFSAVVQILNQSGQELDDSDLAAQWADAVAQTGGVSVSFGVTDVVGDGGNTGTGSQGTTSQMTPTGAAAQTGASNPAVHQCGDPSWSGWSDPLQYISCLTSKGLTTIGLLAIGLLIGIVLIVAVERRPGPV